MITKYNRYNISDKSQSIQKMLKFLETYFFNRLKNNGKETTVKFNFKCIRNKF